MNRENMYADAFHFPISSPKVAHYSGTKQQIADTISLLPKTVADENLLDNEVPVAYYSNRLFQVVETRNPSNKKD